MIKTEQKGKNSVPRERKSSIHGTRPGSAGTQRERPAVPGQKLEIKQERRERDMQQVMHQNKKKGTVAFSYSYGII